MKSLQILKSITDDVELLQDENSILRTNLQHCFFHLVLHQLAEKNGVTKNSLHQVLIDNNAADLLLIQCDTLGNHRRVLEISINGVMMEYVTKTEISTVKKLLFVLKS